MTPDALKSVDWRRLAGRIVAAAPALLAGLGVAMAAGSTPRPDLDQRVERVARLTHGDLSPAGLSALTRGMDPAQLALAIRHDPGERHPELYGLTPGWETLSISGRPTLALGASGLQAQRLNAEAPALKALLRPARPFVFRPATAEDRRRALRCLTQAVYYEAALEPTEGQEGVAQVVLNRVRDPNYPDSVCGVVFQGAERTTGCQFSFTCDGALALAPAGWAWDRARRVAERALGGYVSQKVGTATHYHADYVRPWWAPTLNKLTQIGAHIFYRWKGVYGETAAFSQPYRGKEPFIDEARFARPRLQIASEETVADAQAAVIEAAAGGEVALRKVEIDGQTRIVGAASLGGRRPATREEVTAINERLARFEAQPAPAAPPVGVTPMAVEEVGRPAA